MRPRTLLILFLVVAGLAGFIWFVEGDLPGTDERAELAKRLLVFEPEEVTRLTVERGTQSVAFERSQDDGWVLVEPVTGAAESASVDALLEELAGLEMERTFADGEAAGLGLAPPRALVSLVGPQGEKNFFVGSEVPASESMIAALDPAGPFHVVARSPWTAMDRSTDEWRDRTVFPGQREEIERVALIRGGEHVVLARQGDDFFLQTPLVDRADKGTVTRFLDVLVGLEVGEFVDREPAGFEAADPERMLEVSIRGRDAPWRLEIGRAVQATEDVATDETVDLRFVRAGQQIYLVPDTLSEGFERSAREWRSLEWSTRQVHEIDRLEVEDEVGTLTLDNDAGNWRRDGVEIEYTTVSDLLYALTGAKAEGLDAGGSIEGSPLIRLTINPGEAAEVLEVFPATDDAHPATTTGRDASLWLGGDLVRGIVSKVAAVRAAPPSAEESIDPPEPAASPSPAESAADPG